MKNQILITVFIATFFSFSCKKSKNLVVEATYNTGTSNTNFGLNYADTTNNSFLRNLKAKYNLNSVISGSTSDLERVVRLTDWVKSKWIHDGNNSPSNMNTDQILSNAILNGVRYSCVGYGIVLAGCFNAVGLKSRVLGLKRKDVETASCCAGHVCTEVFLNDIKKWVLADAQFDVVPAINNLPLNAYELREAINNNNKDLVLLGSKNNQKEYINFVSSYLYFFDIRLNNSDNGIPINSKTFMLAPIGVAVPSKFQINGNINLLGVVSTNYVGDFYTAP